MDANVTPRTSKRRTNNLLLLTPDKDTDNRGNASDHSKSDVIHLRPNILNWDSSDASPMPDEGILRDFDLDTKYGPCCTLTRRERWQRASLLGLHPPLHVLDLIEKSRNNTSVLDLHMKQVS